MLSGTHRNSLQEQALEALTDLAKAFGAHRLMITSTASLAGPGGLAQHLAKDQLALWAGVENVEGLGVYRVGPGPDRADVSKLTPGVRMVAIPTTLSAAEFTAFAGVTDVSRRAKEGYGHPLLAPRAVVLDPAMTLSTPPQLWFSTGMKAVDHAVEQLCNPVRSPYADALAEAGLKGLAQGLLATKGRPGDLDARLMGPGLKAIGHKHGRPSEKLRKSLSFASSCRLIRGFPANLTNPRHMSRIRCRHLREDAMPKRGSSPDAARRNFLKGAGLIGATAAVAPLND